MPVMLRLKELHSNNKEFYEENKNQSKIWQKITSLDAIFVLFIIFIPQSLHFQFIPPNTCFWTVFSIDFSFDFAFLDVSLIDLFSPLKSWILFQDVFITIPIWMTKHHSIVKSDNLKYICAITLPTDAQLLVSFFSYFESICWIFFRFFVICFILYMICNQFEYALPVVIDKCTLKYVFFEGKSNQFMKKNTAIALMMLWDYVQMLFN